MHFADEPLETAETPWCTREYPLDFVDDLALLSHTQGQMQEKTSTVDNSARLGLKIHRGKSKVLKNNAAVSTTPITLEGDELKEVTSFTYTYR